jgi:hypothetical protein
MDSVVTMSHSSKDRRQRKQECRDDGIVAHAQNGIKASATTKGTLIFEHRGNA